MLGRLIRERSRVRPNYYTLTTAATRWQVLAISSHSPFLTSYILLTTYYSEEGTPPPPVRSLEGHIHL